MMAVKKANSNRLDGLLGHLCSSTGLYSKDTFSSLYGCITKLVRDRGMQGFVITRTLGDEDFEPMTTALEERSGLSLFRLDEEQGRLAGLDEHTGLLIVMTDRLCATLFWSSATYESFRMFEGGWTFHPGDSRTMAEQLVQQLGDQGMERLLAETPTDRRYDEKLNVLLTALVMSLENRNRDLRVALDRNQMLNDRVVNSERMAAVGQLSSVIAHEIRNPLGLIDLYAKLTEDQMQKCLAAEGPITEKQQELLFKNLSLIRQATASLETILSELSNYAKPLTLNTEATDVCQMVEDVVAFYQPKYDEKGVTLDLSGERPALGMMTVDANRIRQALINLLKNALEASETQTTVRVAVASRQNDPQVYIKVSDEGCGVDDRAKQKLFTPYFSTKGNGTGLGLAHSRKILQAHGGNVELLSTEKGKGSTFALILPKTVLNGHA